MNAHHPNCDTNDRNPDGIVKPCNCGFTISADGKSITCLRCRRTSYNGNDVAYRFCGHCGIFHDDHAVVAVLLNALEAAETEMTSGWREPRSTALTLATLLPAVRLARRFLKTGKP